MRWRLLRNSHVRASPFEHAALVQLMSWVNHCLFGSSSEIGITSGLPTIRSELQSEIDRTHSRTRALFSPTEVGLGVEGIKCALSLRLGNPY